MIRTIQKSPNAQLKSPNLRQGFHLLCHIYFLAPFWLLNLLIISKSFTKTYLIYPSHLKCCAYESQKFFSTFLP